MADPVLALEDEVGLGEPSVEVAGADLVVGEDVVARERVEDGRRAVVERIVTPWRARRRVSRSAAARRTSGSA